MTSPSSVHGTECSGLVHWDDPEGWDTPTSWLHPPFPGCTSHVLAAPPTSRPTLLPTPKVSLPFHYSLETLDHWTKPREGLSENPLTHVGFPGGTSGKEPICQCRRHEIRVQSLGQEDSLEEGMATHSSILAWRIPCTETQRKPEVPASPRGEALFRCARPSGLALGSPIFPSSERESWGGALDSLQGPRDSPRRVSGT